MEDTPQKRLKLFIDARFNSVSDFAKQMGVKPSDVYKYIDSGKSVFSNEEKFAKLTLLGLNMTWYKTGEGEMFLPLKNEPEPDSDYSRDEYQRLEYYAEKYYGSISNMGVQCDINANVLYMYKNKRQQRHNQQLFNTPANISKLLHRKGLAPRNEIQETIQSISGRPGR